MFISVIISSASLIFLSSSIAYSQQVTGNLQGSVTDVHGKPLPDVNVTVSGDDVQGFRGATTNTDGLFRVLALPVGRVTVEISHIANHPVKSENVPIRLGRTTTLGEVKLEPADH